MASSSCWKLRALMKKNCLIMRRNICSTFFEILFPIALILLCFIIRQAFQLVKYYFNEEETNLNTYITNTSRSKISHTKRNKTIFKRSTGNNE